MNYLITEYFWECYSNFSIKVQYVFDDNDQFKFYLN